MCLGQNFPADSWPCSTQSIDQVKGWTRSSIVLLILLAASELDLSDADSFEHVKPLVPVLEKCWMVPVHAI